MANSAPYEVNVTGSDDETFAFNIPFESADGSPFPFEDYEIEYVLAQDGREVLRLSQGAGITIDDPNVTFKAVSPIRPGEYNHGCRIRHLATGDLIQLFDGTATIGEGNF